MIEYYILGTSRSGEIFPREHGMTNLCIQQVVDAYVLKYPNCIHVNIDIALPDLSLIADRRHNFLDGR